MDDSDRRETHYVRCLKCSKILKCSRYDTNALLEHIRTDHPEIEIIDSSMPRGKKRADKTVSPNNSLNQTVVDADRTLTPDQHNKTVDRSNDRTLTQELANQSDYAHFTPRNTSSRERMRINSQKVADHSKRSVDECSLPTMRNNSQGDNVEYTRRYQVQSPSSSPIDQHFTGTGTGTGHKRSLYRTSIEKWRPASGTIYCPKCGANKRPLIRTESERVTDSSCGAACLLSCWPLCFLPFLTPTNNQEYLHCSNCRSFLGLYNRDNNCVRPNRDFVDNSQTIHPETTK